MKPNSALKASVSTPPRPVVLSPPLWLEGIGALQVQAKKYQRAADAMRIFTLALLFLGSTTAGSTRIRRGSYSLPDGSEFIVGLLKTSFRCRANGYFADVDNDCQVFHVCHEQPNFMGPSRYQLFSFSLRKYDHI
ncbi:uncharacterized protein LOC119387484 [Rhipicephalus sanguineus]|uniref:uncharacterized protein LOC119387484 n=1 Tax=Rhipicephalus sanguineus TaxID=34632 RepID=UPI0020C56C4F|nr:uncharacterized protein LOC119387484 [Rhipicephalus sanguineus]